jgi:hypothetical protein
VTLDDLWAELESEPVAERATGRRRIHADGPVDLYVTLAPGGIRGLCLVVRDSALPEGGLLPATRGIDHREYSTSRPGFSALELRLTDRGATDIFSALAADVAGTTALAGDDVDAVGRWITRIARWQRLLAASPTGLGPERQRGLHAELHVMREHLQPRIGIEAAVLGWEGPAGGHDFQLRGLSLEVKSAASHEPQVVTINSERQLDETGTDGLYLVHVSLDVHQNAGESLPEMVASLRAEVADTPVSLIFEDRLMDAGYADVHEPRYRATGYTIREENYLRVGPGFPRLIEQDLPEGIGGVRYSVVIAMCMEFRVELNAALAPLENHHGD